MVAVLGSATAGTLLRLVCGTGGPAAPLGEIGFARIAWFWIPLGVLTAIYTSLLHTKGRFIAAACGQSFPILGTLLGCVWGAGHFGPQALVLGQSIGYCMHLILLLWLSGRIRIGFDWNMLGQLLKRLPLAYVALLIFVIYPFSDSFLGSRVGPSAVSYLGYVQRLVVGIASLTVTGVSTVIFPTMAKLAAEGNEEQVMSNLKGILRGIIIVVSPLVATLVVFSPEAVYLIFERGAFTRLNTIELAGLLPYMLVGIVAACCMIVVFRVLFASGRVWLAAGCSFGGVCCYIGSSLGLVGSFGLKGIGMGYMLSWWGLLIVSLLKLKLFKGMNLRRLIEFPFKVGGGLCLLLAVDIIGACFIKWYAAGVDFSAYVFPAMVVGCVGGVVYAIVLFSLDVREIVYLKDRITCIWFTCAKTKLN